MAKKIILALLILILIIIGGIALFGGDTIDIYIDGENVTVETTTFSDIDRTGLTRDICDYTLKVMNDTTTDIPKYKQDVKNICMQYGLKDPKINLDSSFLSSLMLTEHQCFQHCLTDRPSL